MMERQPPQQQSQQQHQRQADQNAKLFLALRKRQIDQQTKRLEEQHAAGLI